MADLKKKEEMEAEEEMAEDEDQEESEKSTDLTEDDLQKSLDQLESLVAEEDKPTRKQQLIEKAQSAGELEKSERDELFSLLGGEVEDEPHLSDDIEKSMSDVVDVSEYLDRQHEALTKSLSVLADHVEKSDNRQNEFNMILAKAVGQVGKSVQAISERLIAIEDTPARAPKSHGAQPMQKSFANAPQATDQPTRVQILDALEDMSKSYNGTLEDGTDLLTAIVKYESTGAISQALLERVKNHKASA